MKLGVLTLVLAVFTWLAAAQEPTVLARVRFRLEMDRGVSKLNKGNYAEAEGHFRSAVQYDPDDLRARLFLVVALEFQVQDDANSLKTQQSIDELRKILERDPNNLAALLCTGAHYFYMKKISDVREFEQRAIRAAPGDPEAYYWLGVMDWAEVYLPRMEARAKLGLIPSEDLKDKKVCAELKHRSQVKVDEGISAMRKVLEIRPDNTDAMAYLNLLYREDADINCEDPQRRAKDKEHADEMIAKYRKSQKQGETARPTTMADPSQVLRWVCVITPPPPPPSPPLVKP